jgi:hypothetical protein
MTTSLFCDDEIRGAMLTLARELRERTLMRRDEIDALMSRYELRDAQERILAELSLDAMLPVRGQK